MKKAKEAKQPKKAKEAKIKIRLMTRSDIHEVLALNRIIQGLKRDVISFEDMASANPGTPPDLSFVAEAEDRIVGFAINRSMYLMVPLTEVCIIHAIFVHPEYQDRGIGSQLIKALLKHCQTEGISTVRALVPKDNEVVQDLFRRQGFKRSSIINFDKACKS
jgi:ribosomal protein S18 acetylase RimI-like enzyme